MENKLRLMDEAQEAGKTGMIKIKQNATRNIKILLNDLLGAAISLKIFIPRNY